MNDRVPPDMKRATEIATHVMRFLFKQGVVYKNRENGQTAPAVDFADLVSVIADALDDTRANR